MTPPPAMPTRVVPSELLPCPFCGSTNIRVMLNDQFGGAGDWQVYHDIQHGCHVSSATSLCPTKQDAIDDWNRRAAPQPAASDNEAFERAARVCQEIADRKFGQQHAAAGSFATADECARAIRALINQPAAGNETAATQHSTGDLRAAPSQEDVGRGDVALAAATAGDGGMPEEPTRFVVDSQCLCGVRESPAGDYVYASDYDALRTFALKRGENADCICRGNWRAIVKKYSPLIGRRFSREGVVYTFYGIVHADDDYYYGLSTSDASAKHKLILSSCVGALEDSYELIDAAKEK